jgi:O-antigen/teichoic acid export membrane protein
MKGRGSGRDSLVGAAARGGFVLGAATAIERGALLVRAVILARILSPSDFGLMGLALVVIYAAESFTETGFYKALVQKKEGAEEYLDTVFTVSALRGLALFLLVWAGAPLAGAFFEAPGLTSIVRVVALVFVIQGLQNPCLALLERKLSFVRFTATNLGGVACDLAVSFSLALIVRNVWAMVWGYLLGRATFVILSYVVRPYRPRLKVRWPQAVEFRRYGRHIFRFTAVDYVTSQADKIFVGRLAGVEPLGLFSLASRITTIPARGFFDIVSTVAFPVFSEIQDQASRVRSAFVRSLGVTCALAAPIYAGLWCVSGDLVAAFLDERWTGMVPPLRALCVGGPLMAMYLLMCAALSGKGRPDLAARGSYVLTAGLLLPLYPAIRILGIVGAAWCVTLAAVAALAYLLSIGARALGSSASEALRSAMPPLLASIAMAMVIVAWRSRTPGPAGLVLLAAEILVFAVMYPLLLAGIDRAMQAGVIDSFQTIRTRLFGGRSLSGS